MALSGKNGMAGIVNGKIMAINPQEGGRPAVLLPPEEGVEIYVNGTEVKKTIELKEEDQIEVKPLVSTVTALMRVNISPDGLAASLAVFPQITHSFFLNEAEMTMNLRPGIGKKKVREKVCTLAGAEAELRKNKVTFGLDFAALKEVVEKAEGQFKVVARGKKVKQGKNGFVEFLIKPEIEKINYGEKKEKVDYRERYRFPVVQKGNQIALIHPPVEGFLGQSVTGDIISPPAVKDATIRCGEGVVLQDNGCEITAVRDGLLTVRGGLINVENLLVHNKDVDLESGNLHFNGNIHVYGSIREGMQVETQGDLYVDGNGYEATVKAGKGVHFTGNLIRCRVEGGLHFTFLQRAALLLEKISKGYNNFLKSVKQVLNILRERKQTMNEQVITFTVNSILEKYMPAIQGPVTKLEQLLNRTKIQENQQTGHLREILIFLKKTGTLHWRFKDTLLLERIGNELKALLTGFQATLEKIPPLCAAYVQNSNLNHSGEIHIVGAGCYRTTLRAEKGVQVRGVFRGGKISARDDVKVGEFVQITDAAGERKEIMGIKVSAEANIYFGRVHGDTAVQIGKLIYRFDREYERIKVSYDGKKGTLKIVNF